MTTAEPQHRFPAVLRVPSLAQVLPSGVTALAAARGAVTRAGTGRLSERLSQDAVLLTSELVSNALLHGDPPILLRIWCDDGAIVVGVTDHAASLPTGWQRQAPEPEVGGRGLRIVAALATEWGFGNELSQDGKSVWFELAEFADTGNAG